MNWLSLYFHNKFHLCFLYSTIIAPSCHCCYKNTDIFIHMLSLFGTYYQSHAYIIQVEVKIDRLQETSKDNVLTNYSIEATLFDSGSWYTSDGNPDLLSSNVADIKLQSSSAPAQPLGFHGYVLTGKLKSPKLWSAEKVRNFSHIFSCVWVDFIHWLAN